MVGTGVIEDSDPPKDTVVPYEVEIPLITKERCREIAQANGEPKEILDYKLCFYKEGGGVGGCNGDSGQNSTLAFDIYFHDSSFMFL